MTRSETMAAAQRRYDDAEPPDDESCEVECEECKGIRESRITESEDEPIKCEACHGTGTIEHHAFRTIRRSGDDVLMKCRRCGKEEVW